MLPSIPLLARHIQNHTGVDHSNLEKHWGYADRIVPCVNDPGSCAYLDVVYGSHDRSMLYTFIMWGVLGLILLVWVVLRVLQPHRRTGVANGEGGANLTAQSSPYRAKRTIAAFVRRWLLPESLVGYFGHVSRLQVAILSGILTYLLIFSFIGITYKTWVTPIKNSTEMNTRITAGAFSDRIGALAYALTPATVLLAMRESVLSLLTGVPYQSFNFLHRYLGKIIFVQSFVHTLIWTVIEGKLYRPQPKVFRDFIKQQYAIFGIFAMLFITYLYVFSTRWAIRWTGYEFFRKTHYVVALLYIGACWGHWDQLYCWMVPSLALIVLDRAARLVRTAIIHRGGADPLARFAFIPAPATVRAFADASEPDGAVVRLDFHQRQQPWSPGEHFYLTFPELTIWQSHPFTTASLPILGADPRGLQHTYIIRACKGETARLAALVHPSPSSPAKPSLTATTPVLLSGPYGHAPLAPRLATPTTPDEPPNLLAIAGGTGISFALPLALDAVARRTSLLIELVWIVRRTVDLAWVAPELRALARYAAGTGAPSVRVRVFVTRETPGVEGKGEVVVAEAERGITDAESSGSDAEGGVGEKEIIPAESSGSDAEGGAADVVETDAEADAFDVDAVQALFRATKGWGVERLDHRHPVAAELVDGFLERVPGGRTMVVASGPLGLGRDLKEAVAARNEPGRVWRGDEKGDVGFVWDERLTL